MHVLGIEPLLPPQHGRRRVEHLLQNPAGRRNLGRCMIIESRIARGTVCLAQAHGLQPVGLALLPWCDDNRGMDPERQPR